MPKNAVDEKQSPHDSQPSMLRNSSLESLEQQARDALAHSPLMALRRLHLDRFDKRLMISGRVATFYQKQQAQELVRSSAPGLIVVNEVEVS